MFKRTPIALAAGMLFASTAVLAQDEVATEAYEDASTLEPVSAEPAAEPEVVTEEAEVAVEDASEEVSDDASDDTSNISEIGASSYLSFLGGYTFANEDRPGSDDYAAGVSALWGSTGADGGGFGYEIGFMYDTFETGSAVGTDFYRALAGIDLVYTLGANRADGLKFFGLIGGGASYNDVIPDDDDGYSGYANAGLGFVTGPITEAGQLRLRVEARYIYDGFDALTGDALDDVRVGVGLELPLMKQQVVEVPVEKETVEVVQVASGLTDSDGDGVVDEKDQCPGTAPGTYVDGNGCELPKVIELKGVHFEFDKARLLPDGQTILNWATEILLKYPDMLVEIAGHTDSVGTDEYNLGLSQRRAEAVVAFLTEHGVPASQMSARGYGEAEPVDSNDTDEGRMHNRRVELRILN